MADPAARFNTEKPACYRVRVGKKKFLRIVVE
jgi:hypothetical protein